MVVRRLQIRQLAVIPPHNLVEVVDEQRPDALLVSLDRHPDAVFDTALWTEHTLETSARRYGLTVEEYKTRNVLVVEVTSRDVAEAAAALVNGTFSKSSW